MFSPGSVFAQVLFAVAVACVWAALQHVSERKPFRKHNTVSGGVATSPIKSDGDIRLGGGRRKPVRGIMVGNPHPVLPNKNRGHRAKTKMEMGQSEETVLDV